MSLELAQQAATLAKLRALAIAPRPSLMSKQYNNTKRVVEPPVGGLLYFTRGPLPSPRGKQSFRSLFKLDMKHKGTAYVDM